MRQHFGYGGSDSSIQLENKMFKHAEFLREEVGISNLGKVLAAYPNLFTLDIDSQIIPAVNFLFDLGMDEEEVPRVLEAHPVLFETTTIQMQSVVDFLLELEVSEEILGSIFRAFPALLTQDTTTTMTEVVSFLDILSKRILFQNGTT
eukprot:928722_1